MNKKFVFPLKLIGTALIIGEVMPYFNGVVFTGGFWTALGATMLISLFFLLLFMVVVIVGLLIFVRTSYADPVARLRQWGFYRVLGAIMGGAFVIEVLAFKLTALCMSSFTVVGFAPAVFGATLTFLLGIVLSLIAKEKLYTAEQYYAMLDEQEAKLAAKGKIEIK